MIGALLCSSLSASADQSHLQVSMIGRILHAASASASCMSKAYSTLRNVSFHKGIINIMGVVDAPPATQADGVPGTKDIQ